MAEHTFKTGDVVQLVSGGPRMTVDHERGDGLLSCVWFAGLATVHEGFDPAMLVDAKDKVVSPMPMKSVLLLDFGVVDVPHCVSEHLGSHHIMGDLAIDYAFRQQDRQKEAYLRGDDMTKFCAEDWYTFRKATLEAVKRIAA